MKVKKFIIFLIFLGYLYKIDGPRLGPTSDSEITKYYKIDELFEIYTWHWYLNFLSFC